MVRMTYQSANGGALMAREHAVTRSAGANWGAKVWRWLTTFDMPRSRAWKIAAIITSVIVGVIIFVLYGVRLFGVVPLAGRSMEPTFKALAIWPHLAAYYRTNAAAKLELGCLVEFRMDGEADASVKRVSAISTDGSKVWVKADNFGVTGKDSDTDYGWIPIDHVRKITWVWTPTRASRSTSKEGRLKNWAEMRVAPSDVSWGPEGYWSAQRPGVVEIYHGQRLVRTIRGRVARCQDGVLFISQPKGAWQYEYLSYSFGTEKTRTHLGNDWQARQNKNYAIRPPLSGEVDLREAVVSPEMAAAIDNDPATSWEVGPTDGRIKTGSIRFRSPQRLRCINASFLGDASVQVRIKADGKVYVPNRTKNVTVVTIELEKGNAADCGQISEISLQKG